MKKICLLFFLVAATGIIRAQKNVHKLLNTDVKIVKSSGKIWIHEIDQIPIMSIDQVQGQHYIYNYRISKTSVFKKKEGSKLTSAIIDTTQYLFDVNKKCPFMGKYAVEFRQGKKSLTIIISSEPCDKAIIFCPGSITDKKHIDLIEKGSIIAAIQNLLAPVVNVEQKK